MAKKRKSKHGPLVWGFAISMILIFLILLVFFAGIYVFDWNNRFIAAIQKIVPFPAAYAGKAGIITIGEVNGDLAAVRKFYDSQDFEQVGMRVDFGTDQGKKRLKIKEKEILNKLVENKIVEHLAKKRSLSVGESDIQEALEASIGEFGNKQNLMSELARLYGWSLADFKEKVIRPELFAQKLAEAYAQESDFSDQKKKVGELFGKISQKQEDFSGVARQFSEGESAKNDGDLGWSTKNQLIWEIAERANSMKSGDTSGIIESSLGFHILKMEEKKTEDGEELVRLRQIFVKKPTFGDWLAGQMKGYKIIVLLKDYKWDSETANVEFKNEDLRQFEENIDLNSQGDPSVFE